MKVYRETADASMYYRETSAYDYRRIDSSAYPISFPLNVKEFVSPPQVEGIEPQAGRDRNDLDAPSTQQEDR